MPLRPRATADRVRGVFRRRPANAALADETSNTGVVGNFGVADDERQRREAHELRERLYRQWSEGRAARRAVLADLERGHGGFAESNLKSARVPYGVDLAAAWSWRFLVIAGALAIVLWLVHVFMVVVLPLIIALLLAALATPVVQLLQRVGLSRRIASLVVVLTGLVLISLLLTFVGSQVASGFNDLSR